MLIELQIEGVLAVSIVVFKVAIGLQFDWVKLKQLLLNSGINDGDKFFELL